MPYYTTSCSVSIAIFMATPTLPELASIIEGTLHLVISQRRFDVLISCFSGMRRFCVRFKFLRNQTRKRDAFPVGISALIRPRKYCQGDAISSRIKYFNHGDAFLLFVELLRKHIFRL